MDSSSSSVVVRVEGIAAASAGDAAAVADLLCSVDGVQKSDFAVSSVEKGAETATARISCSGADVAEAVVQKIHGSTLENCKLKAEIIPTASLSSSTSSPTGGSDSPTSNEKKSASSSSLSSPSSVLVSGLPADFDVSSLEAEFAKFGIVVGQKAVKGEENDNGEDDGKAEKAVSVTYSSKTEAAEAAKALNGSVHNGVSVTAKISSADSSATSTPVRKQRSAQQGQHGGQQQQRRQPPHHLLHQQRFGGVGVGGGGGGGLPGAVRNAAGGEIDFPLRILVQSDMVGAIIGRGGQTIRSITQQTRARVDVHRKENVGSTEKAITIYGQPENCTKACAEILKVMREEAKTAANDNAAENEGGEEEGEERMVSLKILAHNNLIGRIIGKGGATIKKIMEETGTKITVSSISDINAFNVERTITIAANEVEGVSRAEAEISSKLRKAYEHDVQEVVPQSMMFPGLHPAAMMSVQGMGLAGVAGGPQQGAGAPQSAAAGSGFASHAGQTGGPSPASAGGGHSHGHSNGWGRPHGGPNHAANAGMFNGSGQRHQPPSNHHAAAAAPMNPFAAAAAMAPQGQFHPSQQQETTFLYIPNNCVGAIIGPKGNNIRYLMKFSGASVKISQQQQQQQEQQQQPATGEEEQEAAESAEQPNDAPPAVSAAAAVGSNGSNGVVVDPNHRKVTIVGTPEAQWKAQYLIFEKICEEEYRRGSGDDVRLTVELTIPTSQIGRIIGKGGASVRELQKITGANVKFPEQPQGGHNQQTAADIKGDSPVHIIGPFYASQSAQRRIRAMVQAHIQQQQHQQQQQQPQQQQQQQQQSSSDDAPEQHNGRVLLEASAAATSEAAVAVGGNEADSSEC